MAARGGSWRQHGHGSTGGFTGIVGRPGGASAFNGSPVLHPHHHSEKYYRLTNSVAAEKAGVEPRARLASIGSVASVATALDYVGTQGGAPRQAGIRSSIITLMNATVGASMLVLPFGTPCRATPVRLCHRADASVRAAVCGEMGVVVFVVLAIIVAFLSSQSLQLLTKCVQVTEQSCYQGGMSRKCRLTRRPSLTGCGWPRGGGSGARGVRLVGCNRHITHHHSAAHGVHDRVPGGGRKHAEPGDGGTARGCRQHVRPSSRSARRRCARAHTFGLRGEMVCITVPCGKLQLRPWSYSPCACFGACTTCGSRRTSRLGTCGLCVGRRSHGPHPSAPERLPLDY